MILNISTDNPLINYSHKVSLYTALLTLFFIYFVYTPDFVITIDEENNPVNDHALIVSTSILIGLSVGFIYMLTYVKVYRTKQNTNTNTNTSIGSSYI